MIGTAAPTGGLIWRVNWSEGGIPFEGVGGFALTLHWIVNCSFDGVAGVPGILRISVASEDGKINVGGGLDPGYPLPGKIRQAQLPLPKGTKWEGLILRAEMEVKGVLHPVRWACHQKTNPDGSLTLRRNLGRG